MHENTRGKVAVLVSLMFHRLDRFDGLIFGGGERRINGGDLYSGC